MKKYVILALKFLVSAGIIYYLFSRIDFGQYLGSLKELNVYLFVLGLFVSLSSLLALTAKWRVLLRMLRLELPFGDLLKLNLTGFFYALLLPGGLVSGEAVKGYRLAKGRVDKLKLVFSIFIDKYIGLIAILVLGFIAYLVDASYSEEIFTIYGVILLAALFAYVSLVSPAVRKLLKNSLGRLPLIKTYVQKMQNDEWISPKHINRALLYGFLMQFIVTAAISLLFWSLGLHIAFFRLIWINSLVTFGAMFPITLMGIGLREMLFVYLLGQFGFSQVESLSVATLIFLVVFIRALMGGALELKRYWLN